MRPLYLFASISILLVILIGVVLFSLRGDGDQSRHAAFPAHRFLQDQPQAHHGNHYVLEGVVLRQLEARTGSGRLVVVENSDAELRLPVLIPASISDSLYVGQRYWFEIEVQEDRLLVNRLRRL